MRWRGISLDMDAPTAIRIVLADGQALFREAVRTILEGEPGLSVVAVAADGRQAVIEAERHRPDVVILTDGLPERDGIQATHQIRKRIPATRVVFLADDEDSDMVIAALEAGANGYLTKRCVLTELIEATRVVSRGETLVQSRTLGRLIERLMRRRTERTNGIRALSRLTRREREVLALLAAGGNNKSIGQALYISPQTARTHVQHVLSKLGVHSRLAAAAFAMQEGVRDELGGMSIAGGAGGDRWDPPAQAVRTASRSATRVGAAGRPGTPGNGQGADRWN
jgi:DNA-binding NarL/FixJ family response regulator